MRPNNKRHCRSSIPRRSVLYTKRNEHEPSRETWAAFAYGHDGYLQGASRPPAVAGSITIDHSGMPTMENPLAPFLAIADPTGIGGLLIVVY